MNMDWDSWIQFIWENHILFTIQYPPFPAYFQQYYHPPERLETIFKNSHPKIEETLLYLHIPYCHQKCAYCNFATEIMRNKRQVEQYLQHLTTEFHQKTELLNEARIRVSGINIGGGTPSIVDKENLSTIFEQIWQEFPKQKVQSSIEVNLNDMVNERQKLDVIGENISRLSVGIQSFNDTVLQSVHRPLSFPNKGFQENLDVFSMIQSRFSRWNVDMIFGLPNQTLNGWEQDIERLIAIQPDSITLYDCLYFGSDRGINSLSPPNPHDYGEFYNFAYYRLLEAGYHGDYGSSSFSRHQGESGASYYYEQRLRSGASYLGCGNYASSWVGDRWWFNKYSTTEYNKAIHSGNALGVIGDYYQLPPIEQGYKQLLWMLSFGQIDIDLLKKTRNFDLRLEFSKEMEFLIKHGILREEKNRLNLVEGQYNNLFLIRGLFYPLKAQKWIWDKFQQP